MYDRILIPTDGSDGARRAIEHGARLAAENGADLHALYVMNVGELPPNVDREAADQAVRNRGERAMAEVLDVASEYGIDEVTEAFVRGSIHQSIVEYAEDHEVDLVVMGTHGRSGFERYLIGSVTENVIRNSPIPVLAVRTTGNEDG